MKIMESRQRDGEETTRNPWDMETNLQYIDKQLAYQVISKDDSLLQGCTLMHTQTNTQTPHYGLCRDSKENICVLKVLPVIFSYFFPPAVIIFSPVKQIKMPGPNGDWGSGSYFPLSGSQMRCSYKQALCEETWPMHVGGSVHADCACVCVWEQCDLFSLNLLPSCKIEIVVLFFYYCTFNINFESKSQVKLQHLNANNSIFCHLITCISIWYYCTANCRI